MTYVNLTFKLPNIIRSFTFRKASGKTWVSYKIAQLPRRKENERIKGEGKAEMEAVVSQLL